MRQPAQRDRGRRERGFGLVELLVTIGIIAILVSLTLPVISVARRDSMVVSSLATARSAGGVLQAHAASNDGLLPWPGAPDEPGRVPGGAIYFSFSHDWWPVVGDKAGASRMRSPFARGPTFSYWASCAMISDAAFWRQTLRTGPGQWGPQRLSAVQWPSDKLAIVDGSAHGVRLRDPAATRGERWHLAAYFDGSADDHRAPINLYGNADGAFPGSFHFLDVGRGLHTIDGLQGRDRPPG